MAWSFRGTSFERILSGDGEPQWFPQQIARTVDTIAGDVAAVPRRFVDLGAREYSALQLQAAVLTPTARTLLIGYVGTRGTLVAASGFTGTALLVRAEPLARLGGSYYRLTLEFEFVQ